MDCDALRVCDGLVSKALHQGLGKPFGLQRPEGFYLELVEGKPFGACVLRALAHALARSQPAFAFSLAPC